MSSSNEIQVSIVMPCFNVEKFIRECMMSVMHQTLRNIEILVIDAGSTDGTFDVLQECAAKDSRIRLLHSPVKSYGYQMNLGIREARGQYISIVETDDYVEPDMIETLYTNICMTDADYIKGTAEGFYEDIDQNQSWRFDIIPVSEVKEKGKVILPVPQHPELFWTDGFLWMGIYRLDTIKKLRFHESKGAAFQDISFWYQFLLVARKGIYLDKRIYHYRQDNVNASSYNTRGLGYVKDEYEYLEDIEKKQLDKWKHAYYYRLAFHCIDRFNFMAYHEFWDDAWESIPWLQKKIREGLDEDWIDATDFSQEQWFELWLFLHDPHVLWQFDKEKFTYRADKMRNFCKWVEGHSVFLFGCGKRGQRIKALTDCCPFLSIQGFCDNDEKKQGMNIAGLHVYSAEQALHDFPDAIFLVTNAKHPYSIMKQLSDMGVSDDNMREISNLYVDAFTLTRLASGKQINK